MSASGGKADMHRVFGRERGSDMRVRGEGGRQIHGCVHEPAVHDEGGGEQINGKAAEVSRHFIILAFRFAAAKTRNRHRLTSHVALLLQVFVPIDFAACVTLFEHVA
jgi:hypothetical protein